ncbi:MAG: hypothetical protein R3F59_07270 [Myxococcota bacterium]
MSTALPTLVAPSLGDPGRTGARGGFAWWYLDLVDEAGDGVVAIVSLGLPFLPGYASSARAGRAPEARERPSVCLAVVRGGRPWFWALHETDPEDVRWEPGLVRLGGSRFEVRIDGDRVSARGVLQGQLPRCPWRAELEVEGPLRRPSLGEPRSAAHEWTVLTAVARGSASVRACDRDLTVTGRAYLDRNTGDRWLGALDCADWTWGRLALPEAERIWYVATAGDGVAHSRSVTIDARGHTEVVEGRASVVGWRRTAWGLAVPTAVAVDRDLVVPFGAPLDDSPFYARFLVAGGGGRGVAEVCRPGAIDAAWFRPLLRMTVCNDRAPAQNSVWLPLFGGTRAGRLARLVGLA